MKISKKVLLGIIVILVIGGGAGFAYFQKEQAKVVFEAGADKKETEMSTPIEAKQEIELPRTEETQTIVKEDEKTVAEKKEANTDSVEEKTSGAPKENESSKDMPPKGFAIKSNLVSFGHESASGRKIDTVVLHSSYSPNGDPYSVSAVIGIWKSYGVAPHYMIARDGTVYQLVADKDIAYHAGESQMKDGRKNVNDFSIGVEILNTKDDEYTKAQYQAVKDLVSYLKGKYSIKYVVGHDDIAPGRKTDPWNFNWSKI